MTVTALFKFKGFVDEKGTRCAHEIIAHIIKLRTFAVNVGLNIWLGIHRDAKGVATQKAESNVSADGSYTVNALYNFASCGRAGVRTIGF